MFGAQTLMPSGDSDGYAQWVASPLDFDLDRVQASQGPAGNDLPAWLIGSRQHDDELALERASDAVEETKLAPECRG
jgi:hypothetical protein